MIDKRAGGRREQGKQGKQGGKESTTLHFLFLGSTSEMLDLKLYPSNQNGNKAHESFPPAWSRNRVNRQSSCSPCLPCAL